MESVKVGQKYDIFKSYTEGVKFDISDSGAHLIVYFNNPTLQEIQEFESKKRFEIRFSVFYNIIIITTKIGCLNWMDAPYSPHLSKNLSKIQFPQEGEGLSLTLILVNAVDGEVKNLRLLGLSEKFSQALVGTVLEEKMKEFNKEQYAENLNQIYNRYTTEKLVSYSNHYCKFN